MDDPHVSLEKVDYIDQMAKNGETSIVLRRSKRLMKKKLPNFKEATPEETIVVSDSDEDEDKPQETVLLSDDEEEEWNPEETVLLSDDEEEEWNPENHCPELFQDFGDVEIRVNGVHRNDQDVSADHNLSSYGSAADNISVDIEAFDTLPVDTLQVDPVPPENPARTVCNFLKKGCLLSPTSANERKAPDACAPDAPFVAAATFDENVEDSFIFPDVPELCNILEESLVIESSVADEDSAGGQNLYKFLFDDSFNMSLYTTRTLIDGLEDDGADEGGADEGGECRADGGGGGPQEPQQEEIKCEFHKSPSLFSDDDE